MRRFTTVSRLALLLLVVLTPLVSSPSGRPLPRAAIARAAGPGDGETWFISWRATASGSNVSTNIDTTTTKTETTTMVGHGTAHFSAASGWRTANFGWSVTDDYDEKVVMPCIDSTASDVQRTWESVVDPTQPPAWVDQFLNPSGILQNPDGSLALIVTFEMAQTGFPTLPYRTDVQHDFCSGPSTSSTSVQPGASYASVLWNQIGVGVLNSPTLGCDPAGTTCTWDQSFQNTPGQLPINVAWHVQAVRQPAEPDVQQSPELAPGDTYLPTVALSDRLDENLDCDTLSTCSGTRVVQSPGLPATSTAIGPAPSGDYPTTVDVGQLPPGLTRIVAQANAIPAAPPDTKPVQVASKLPSWVSAPLAFLASKIDGHALYTAEFKFPDPAVSGEVDVPSAIPFFGGSPIGLAETQASVKLQVASSGQGQLEGGGTTGFAAAGSTVVGGVTFRMDVTLDATGLHASNGQFRFKLGGKIKKEQPLLEVIPVLAGPVKAIQTFSPWAAKLLQDRAKAKLELEPSFTFTLKMLEDGTGAITFQNGGAQPTFGAKATVSLELIKDVLKVIGGVGGQVATSLQAPPLNLKQVQVQLQALGNVVFYRYNWGGSAGYSWTWPSAASVVKNAAAAAQATGWALADRSYLSQPNYALWSAPTSSTDPTSTATGPVQTRLVQNVYPQASPALAVQLGQRLLTWTHDTTSGNEIAFSTSPDSGEVWTTQALATSDQVDDFNRQVAFVPNGHAVAVWERFDTAMPGDVNANPLAYLSHVQVAAGTWNGTSWSAVKQLSVSGSLNNRPQVVETADGALAVWIGNASDQIVGDATHPDTLEYSWFNQSTGAWSSAAPIVANLAGLTDFSLAAGGGKAAVVYSRDLDGDPSTTSDEELYYVTYDGSRHTWDAAPTQLTTNAGGDDAPRLALTDTGLPQLVWRQTDAADNAQLMFLDGTWDATRATPLLLPDATDSSDLRLVRGSDGTLALTWQQLTGTDTRVGYAVFDPVARVWSAERELTPPVPGSVTGATTMATGITSALEPGLLLVAYQLAHVDATTATAPDGSTIPNVPQVGAHDLYYAEIPLGSNLSVAAGDVSVAPPNAAPGQPLAIAVVVHNTGDLATGPTTVSLVQTGSTTALASANVPALVGGGSATVSIPYTQPTSSAVPLSIDVDPSFLIPETTRDDNVVAVPLSVATSVLGTDDTPLGSRVSAQFQQQGVVQGGVSVISSLRLDDPAGPEVGTAIASFPASPAQATATASTILPAASLGPGRHTIYWMPADDPSSDAIPLAVSNADVLPALSAYPREAILGPAAGSSQSITLTVANDGPAPSASAQVTVYDRDPTLTGAVALGSLPLPPIAAASQATVSGTLTLSGAMTAGLRAAAWPAEVYVQIDPDDTIDQTSRSSSLFVLGQLETTGAPGPSPSPSPSPGATPPPTPSPGPPTRQAYRVYVPFVAR